MKLRGEDPCAMKNFILSVQNRVNELKSCGNGQTNLNNKRVCLFNIFLGQFFTCAAVLSYVGTCRWSSCLRQSVTSRTTKNGLRRSLDSILG